jgi:hypothetical protein
MPKKIVPESSCFFAHIYFWQRELARIDSEGYKHGKEKANGSLVPYLVTVRLVRDG